MPWVDPYTSPFLKKSNVDYTRVITPERVTGGETHVRDLAPGNVALKKCRSGSKSVVTLFPS